MRSGVGVVAVLLIPVVVFAFFLWRSETSKPDDSTSLEERVKALEEYATKLAPEFERMQKNDNALQKVMGEQLADVAERLFRAGITDEKNKNIPRWWCLGDAVCARTKPGCENWRKQADKPPPPCEERRVVYCPGRQTLCVASFERCERILKLSNDSGICVGVE